MKIKNYLLLSATILTTSAFSGNFYVGAGAAYVNSASTIKLTSTHEGYQGTSVVADTTNSTAPRFFAGYEKDNNNCFVAGEIFGAFKDINGKKDLGVLSGWNGDDTQEMELRGSVKYSRDYTVGARVKLGGYITDKMSAFVGLGIINSRFKVSYGDENQSAQSFKKSVFGIEPGVGISYKLSPKWRLGFEYFYQQYRSFNSKNLNTQAGHSAIVASKFKFNTFLASISWII